MSQPNEPKDSCLVGPPDEHLKELIKHSKQHEVIIVHLKRLEALVRAMLEERYLEYLRQGIPD